MVKRLYNPLIARFAAVAALLVLALAAPAVFAQEHDEPPCTMDGTSVECDYDEKGMDPVADFNAMDPEGEGIDWELAGADMAAFDITGGVLTFKESPNYESPTDMAREDDPLTDDVDEEVTGDDNAYEVTVVAIEMLAEGQDPPAKRSMLDVTVTVMNVEEPGTITLDRLQTRVEAAGDGVTATLTDPDRDSGDGTPTTTITNAVMWEWSIPKVSRPILTEDDHWTPAGGGANNTDDDYTPIVGDADSFLRVKASYTDGHGAMKTAYARSAYVVVAALAADATNNTPTFDEATVTFMVAEDAAVDTVVGTVRASDGDSADILSHVLTGVDAGSFEIDIATGEITVNGMLDHEGGSANSDGEYSITVTAYDPSDANVAATVNIAATDVNEKPNEPTSSPAEVLKVNENHDVTVPETGQDDSIVLGTYTVTDPDADDVGDDAPELSLGGDDAGAFTLDEDDGQLRFTASPDYESPTDANMDSVYKVSIVATDDEGLTGMRDLSIEVMNLNEEGTLKVSPDQPGISVALDATLTDPDKGISGAKWQWRSMDTKLDVNALTDTANDGIINDLPATAVIIDGATSMSYTPRPEIKDIETTDEDESYAGDEGMFLIATVVYRDNAPPMDNAATEDEDESLANELVMVSTHAVRKVPDVNNAPVFPSASMTREVNENETTVPDLVTATDSDDDPLEYAITGGADMDAFEIDNDGQITTKGDTELDHEGDQNTYVVVVTASDPFRGSGSTTVTITVMNVNEKPEFEADDPDDYAENGMGAVATFTATDPEMADVEWTISGLDNGVFSIDEATGVLSFKSPPDFEDPGDIIRANDPNTDDDESEDADNNEYLLTVTATEVRAEGVEDAALSTDKDITVTVTNVEEPGTVTLSRLQTRVGASGLTASLTDDDRDTGNAEETTITTGVTWLWSVPKVSRPDLGNDDHWTPGAGDTNQNTGAYESAASDVEAILRAKASYTDGEGDMKTAYAKMENPVVAARTDNENPAFGSQVETEFELPENSPVGTVVGTVRGSDDDSADVLSHVLTAAGVAAGKFEIDIETGVIKVAAALDHEEQGLTDGEYEVTVMVYDPSNASGGEDNNVSITATDVNEKPNVPTSTTDEVSMVDENHAVMDDDTASPRIVAVVLGTYAVTDPDADDVGDDAPELSLGGEDKDAFVLNDDSELLFASSPDYESPTDANGDNKYKVSIVATDGDGLTNMKDLTIEVMNVDEPGSVALDQRQPAIGRPVTATLTDKDGETMGAKWQWYATLTKPVDRDDDDDEVVTAADIADSAKIEGAVSATYTPKATVLAVEDDPATPEDETAAEVPGDEGMFLTATVSYRDATSPKDDEDTDEDESLNQHRAMYSENAARKDPVTNSPPDFGGPMTRMVPEDDAGMPARTAARSISPAVEATDADNDTLRYTISGGADMDAFSIHMDTGVISAKGSTTLDFEGDQTTFMVEVTVTDPFGGSDTTMVTITVTNVNERPTLGLVVTPDAPVTPPVEPEPENNAPEFADDATTREVAENTAAGMAVGAPVAATDADGDTLTYTLGGADAASFDIDEATGQIMTSAALDYETKASYDVTVTASDDEDSDSIDVAISVTNVGLDNAYDTDDSGSISKREVLDAIRAYFDNPSPAAKQDVLELIALYFNGLRGAN